MIYKAIFDEKNLTTDWIESVFDCYDTVTNRNKCIGFVDDYPVIASWNDNVLIFEVCQCEHPETVISSISKRIHEFEIDETDEHLKSSAVIMRNSIAYSFFFDEE